MPHLEKIKNSAISLLKLLLSGSLLFWLYQKGVFDLRLLAQSATPSLVCSGVVLVFLSFFFATWRWQLLLNVQGIVVSRSESLKLNSIGLFFNYVMPGGVGGDVVKGFYIVKENPRNRVGAAVSVLIDRVMGLYAMLILSLLAMIPHLSLISNTTQLTLIMRGLVILFVTFNVGLFLAFSERFRRWGWQKKLSTFALGQKLVSAYEAVFSYSQQRKVLVQVVFLSLISQLVSIVTIWWLGWNLGFRAVDFSTFMAVAPLGFMVTALPISPAGVGVGQMAFFVLFNLFLGHESQLGPLVITGFQILNFILSLSGIWFFIQRKSSLREVETAFGS